MRQLLEILGALLVAGVPSSYLYSRLSAKRNKDRCIANYTGSTGRCSGRVSKLCIDSLCPDHCKRLHGETCVKKFL